MQLNEKHEVAYYSVLDVIITPSPRSDRMTCCHFLISGDATLESLGRCNANQKQDNARIFAE